MAFYYGQYKGVASYISDMSSQWLIFEYLILGNNSSDYIAILSLLLLFCCFIFPNIFFPYHIIYFTISFYSFMSYCFN
jgi:hypothetical protein